MRYKKLNQEIDEARTQENMAAKVQEQEALLEYVAVMSDIELPSTDESEVTDYE